MSITVMCSADTPGAVLSEEWTNDSSNPKKMPIYRRTFAEGCVVSMREMNGYDDSDFYATYYDAESNSFKETMYASTRGWTYPNGASIDATPAVMAAYEAYKANLRKVYALMAEKARLVKPEVGSRVKVVGGRKHAPGTEGVVFWARENFSKYGTWSRGVRLGLKNEKMGVLWIDAKNVEVIGNEERLAEIEAVLSGPPYEIKVAA